MITQTKAAFDRQPGKQVVGNDLTTSNNEKKKKITIKVNEAENQPTSQQ